MSRFKYVGFSFLPFLASQNQQKVNKCDAAEDADALSKIMEEGGGMMDQQEMMEMMMQRKNQLRPYPFEKLMQNAAMFK